MARSTHILVAEDNPQEIFVYEHAFKRIGISSYTFVNHGDEAIRYLQANGMYADRTKFPFPDWLLIDLRLPRTDGFDVLDWLYKHQECRVIPAVAFSDSDRDQDVRRAYELGANAYFLKPTGIQQMVDTLALVDHFWKVAKSPIVNGTERCG
ncbi:MAG: response regulator receiver protein [Verrucomicrobiales bacterium]|nr:response regulator receiver protein [Verrucomicrobiales bacterium]